MQKNNLELLPDMFPLHNSMRSLSLEYNAIVDCGNLCQICFHNLNSVDMSVNQLKSFDINQVLGLWDNIGYIALAENNISSLEKPTGENGSSDPKAW